MVPLPLLSILVRSALFVAVAALARPAFAQNPVALAFGNGDYVELDSAAVSLMGDLTIEAWIRVDQYTAGGRFAQIVQREGAGTGALANAQYTLALTDDGRLDAFHQSGGGGQAHVVLSNGTVPRGRWVHVAEVRDATAKTYQFYIDGVAEPPVPYSENPDGGGGTVTRFGSPGLSLVGQLDEVRIWDHVRTEAEILAAKDDEVDPASSSGLAGYWRFDDGPADTTADLSGNGHTATLFGPTWIADGPPFEGESTGGARSTDDFAITGRDNPVTVDVLANDTGAVRLVDVGEASFGTAVIVGDVIRYVPNAGIVGVDQVEYTAEDAAGALQTATLTVSVAASGAVRIVNDGRFEDWDGVVVLASDPEDQAASEVDLRSLSITNDERVLRLRIALANEQLLQQDNDLVLSIDTDADASTGRTAPGMGADLVYAFGARSGTAIVNGDEIGVEHDDIGFWAAPTFAAREYELELDLGAQVGGAPLFPGDTLLVALATASGERLPQVGAGVAYVLDRATALPDYGGPSLGRVQGAVRVLSYNVRFDSVFEGEPKEAFVRIVQALQPDVIAFQEIYDRSGAEAAALVAEALPPGDGGTWYHGDAGSDNLLVARWPVTLERDLGGNSAFLVETPGGWERDLLVIDVHTPCCDNEAGRLAETDQYMQFVREVGDGNVAGVDAETPFVIVGDMNMVGTDRPLQTMLTGDLVDNVTYGPDFAPDLDGSDLTDALPLHIGTPSSFTWVNPQSDFPAGRLDYIVYTDSALDLDNTFVLYTPDMTADALSAVGLRSEDTNIASDHLPLVADFFPARSSSADTDGPDGIGAFAPIPNPFEERTVFRVQVSQPGRATIEVFDVIGRRVAVAFMGRLSSGLHYLPFDGASLSPGMYLFRVTTEAGTAGGRMVRR